MMTIFTSIDERTLIHSHTAHGRERFNNACLHYTNFNEEVTGNGSSFFMPVDGNFFDLDTKSTETDKLGSFDGFPCSSDGHSIFMPVDGNAFDLDTHLETHEIEEVEKISFPADDAFIFRHSLV